MSAADMALIELDSPVMGGDLDEPMFTGGYVPSQFTSVNGASSFGENTNGKTVSPKDLMKDTNTSFPPSGSTTDLATPSLHGSSGLDSFDTSPIYDDLDTHAFDFPLFTVEETSHGHGYGNAGHGDQNKTPAPQPEKSRQHSLTSPAVEAVRNATSVANSPGRRVKALAPIQVPDDAPAMIKKRARNTEAARRSRQKKAERVDLLEEKIAELERDRDHWKKLAQTNGHR